MFYWNSSKKGTYNVGKNKEKRRNKVKQLEKRLSLIKHKTQKIEKLFKRKIDLV